MLECSDNFREKFKYFLDKYYVILTEIVLISYIVGNIESIEYSLTYLFHIITILCQGFPDSQNSSNPLLKSANKFSIDNWLMLERARGEHPDKVDCFSVSVASYVVLQLAPRS